MNNKLKPYMGYSRHEGSEEGAMLVLAHNGREAKRLAWSILSDWWAGIEYTDMAVRLLRDDHVLALADQKKLAAGEPHVIDAPVVCDSCELWGDGLEADGRTCTRCGQDAGDRLVGLYRDYARQTAVPQSEP